LKPAPSLLLLLPALVLLPVLVLLPQTVHGGGWDLIGTFVSAALQPSRDPVVLGAQLQGLGITCAMALVGWAASVVLGLGLGIASARVVWQSWLGCTWPADLLARLLALPLVQRVEARRLDQVRTTVAMQVLSLAADTRKAWVQAVAAEESVRYSRQVMQAAEASAELARRMAQVGNFNKLQQAREQGFYADAALNLARAEQQQRATRERLTRLLGLWGAQTAFKLPERLPDLPRQARDLPDVERTALAQRLDVAAARSGVEATARNLGLTRTTRFINVLELGLVRNSSNEAPTQKGWEIGLELPLFDWGDARVARAEGVYMQALHRAAETAINARSEVREAYGAYRSAWDIARHHREEIVPLKARISEENLLRYNGMLIGVFELLADARSQIASVNGAIDALRDFWIAQADLDMALVGKPSLSAAIGPAVAAGPAGDPGH